MKLVIASVLCLAFIACQGNTQVNTVELKTQKDSVSYSIGQDIGKNLKQQDIEVNPAALAAGLKDAVGGGKMALTQEQMETCMNKFRADLMQKQQDKMKTEADKGKKEGDAFLAANKTKEGVKTTASGLQYKVLKEGSGAKPDGTKPVTVNYRGTLIDGTEFDSSYKNGQPVTFSLNQVIPGWQEGIKLMSPGAKYQFWVPGELGYGPRQNGQIPPNATLIFEVELVSIGK